MIRFTAPDRRILAAAALLAHPAAAQLPDAPDVVVIGSGLPAPPGDAALPIVSIDVDRLREVASGRLEDALRDVAGLAQFRRSDARSANPTSQGITLRGLGGNASSRVLLLLDGVPQTDPFGGWIAFPAYAPERLRAARVTRGGGSGYQGPGALAGTIELASAGPETLPPFGLRAAYGSRDSVDLSGTGAVPLGGGFATLGAAYARGDGFAPVVAEDRGPVDGPAPYEQASAAARAVAPLGGDVELQGNLSAFTDQRTRGTAFSRIKSEGADASVRLVGRGRWGFQLLGYLQTRDFASRFTSIDAERTTVSPALDQYGVPSTGLGARAEVQPPMPAGVTLRLGGDARAVRGRTQELYFFQNGLPTRRREAGGANLTLGGFADATVEQGPLTLTAGGRVDRWRIADGSLTERPLAGGVAVTDREFTTRTGWEATGRAGVAYALVPAVSLRAAAYRGWRLPTLNELYRPFRVGNDTTQANADLSPEHLSGVEAGVDLTPAEGLRAGATLFWNRLTDAIANVTLVATPTAVTRQRRNLDAIRARGAELDLSWQHGALGLDASYAYTDARVEDDGTAAALDGLRPAQTAAHQASATLGWRPAGGPSAALTLRYVAPQFEDDANKRVLADAVTLDARAALPIGRGVAVEARAENLTDTRLEAGISGADVVERASPRTLWIGLRLGIGPAS